jgi:hypothetical protein
LVLFATVLPFFWVEFEEVGSNGDELAAAMSVAGAVTDESPGEGGRA